MSSQAISHRSFLLFIPGVALMFYSLYLYFIYLPSDYLPAFDWRFLLFLGGYAIAGETFLLHWRNLGTAESWFKSVLGLALITLSALVFIVPFTSLPFSDLGRQNYWISIGVAYGLAVGGTFLLRRVNLHHPLRKKSYLTLGSALVVPPLVYLLSYSADVAFNGLWNNLSWLGYLGIAGAGSILALAYLGSPEYYSVAFHTIAITMAYLVWGLLGFSLIPLIFAEWYFTSRHPATLFGKPLPDDGTVIY